MRIVADTRITSPTAIASRLPDVFPRDIASIVVGYALSMLGWRARHTIQGGLYVRESKNGVSWKLNVDACSVGGHRGERAMNLKNDDNSTVAVFSNRTIVPKFVNSQHHCARCAIQIINPRDVSHAFQFGLSEALCSKTEFCQVQVITVSTDLLVCTQNTRYMDTRVHRTDNAGSPNRQWTNRDGTIYELSLSREDGCWTLCVWPRGFARDRAVFIRQPGFMTEEWIMAGVLAYAAFTGPETGVELVEPRDA